MPAKYIKEITQEIIIKIFGMLFILSVFCGPSAADEFELADIEPVWTWSYHLARLAAVPGGERGLEPGFLEFDYTKPREGSRLRRDLYDGWVVGEGGGCVLETGYRIPVGSHFVTRLRIRASAHGTDPDRVRVLEGGLWGATGPLAWSLGRQRFFWSSTPETSLLLSNNAAPFDALSLGSRRDWGLPLNLGGLRWQLLLAYLDDEHRVIPFPLLWGMRGSWNPAPQFSLELKRTVLFGGAGRTERLTPGDLLNLFLARGENLPEGERGPADSDQKLSYALRWRWPLPHFARIYAHQWGLQDLEISYEYGGEDALRRGFPTATGRLIGIRTRIRGWDISGTYAETVDDANRWYEHVVYESGYRYKGWVMSHPPGGDGRWVRVRFGRPWLAMQGFSIEGTWERGGVEDKPSWEVFRLNLRWWISPIPGLRLQAEGEMATLKTGSTATLQPRYPEPALRLSLIVGGTVQMGNGTN
ncbi:MAG: capsule assembly Wzi family protein [Candidatus Eisenbacteria bacterium]|uniref:Capsule assembly Wzi family protein n=1 Tax=Eiseniibacteriota bacterium TaxID=2212470 RepID=A0A948RYW1_UNCEI|nr:capsule assembly Wzi family protein [Candidatus Eisenbacteria bacterium]